MLVLNDEGVWMEGTVALTGQVKVGRALYDVSVDQTKLRWDKAGRKDKQVYSNNVLMLDILAVTCSPPSPSFTVHHVARCRNHVWEVEKKTFLCESEADRQRWMEQIQHRLAAAVKISPRPSSILAMVNPRSGGCQGEKIYQRYGAPLFELAGVKTQVFVSERPQHIVEHLQHCNLDGVDGLVAVGGDGTLSEMISGAFLRHMKDAGKEPADSESDLENLPIRIGIIPAGSSQGRVEWATGCKDPTTAVLHIILGNSTPMNIMSVVNDKLVCYSSLFVAQGFFGETMKYAEDNRQLGRFRYFVAFTRGVWSCMKYYNFDIHYIPISEEEARQHQDEALDDGWYCAKGPFANAVIIVNMDSHDENDPLFVLRVMTRPTNMGLAKATSRFSAFREDMDDLDFIKSIHTRKFKLVNPTLTEGGTEDSSAEGGTSTQKKAAETLVLDVDGEIHTITNPETLVRCHENKYHMFGTTPIAQKLRQKRERSKQTDNKETSE